MPNTKLTPRTKPAQRSAGALSECRRLLQAERRRSRKLRRSNEELSLFGAVAAHDLQEPLRSLQDGLRRLETAVRNSNREELHIQLHRTQNATDRMRKLLEATLTFASLGAKPALESKNLDCEESLREVLEVLHADIAASGARITWSRLPKLRAHPQLLSQLLQNLLGNAIKFRGGSAPEIRVGGQALRGRALLWVKDRGRGVPPARQARLFRPFSRLAVAGVPGHGMGLALCKKIVELHGGKIWLRSRLGRGACFYFTLPLEGAHA